MVSSSFVRTAVTLVAVVASALAAPAVMEPVDASSIEQVADASVAICAGLMKKAVCCEGSVLGLVHTGCVAPFPPPQTAVDFVEQCASEAKAAQCCTLNLVGNSLLCKAPGTFVMGEGAHASTQEKRDHSFRPYPSMEYPSGPDSTAPTPPVAHADPTDAPYHGDDGPTYPLPGKPGYPSQPGYPAQPGYPSEPGYPSKPEYPGKPGYQPQPPYQPQPDPSYAPGYPSQPQYPSKPGYPSQPDPSYPPPSGGGGDYPYKPEPPKPTYAPSYPSPPEKCEAKTVYVTVGGGGGQSPPPGGDMYKPQPGQQPSSSSPSPPHRVLDIWCDRNDPDCHRACDPEDEYCVDDGYCDEGDEECKQDWEERKGKKAPQAQPQPQPQPPYNGAKEVPEKGAPYKEAPEAKPYPKPYSGEPEAKPYPKAQSVDDKKDGEREYEEDAEGGDEGEGEGEEYDE